MNGHREQEPSKKSKWVSSQVATRRIGCRVRDDAGGCYYPGRGGRERCHPQRAVGIRPRAAASIHGKRRSRGAGAAAWERLDEHPWAEGSASETERACGRRRRQLRVRVQDTAGKPGGTAASAATRCRFPAYRRRRVRREARGEGEEAAAGQSGGGYRRGASPRRWNDTSTAARPERAAAAACPAAVAHGGVEATA